MVTRTVFFWWKEEGGKGFFLSQMGHVPAYLARFVCLGVVPHFPRDFACFSIPKEKKRDHTQLRLIEPRTHVISRWKTFIRPGEISSRA